MKTSLFPVGGQKKPKCEMQVLLLLLLLLLLCIFVCVWGGGVCGGVCVCVW